MSDWMLWSLAGFVAICAIAMVIELWHADDIENNEDDWE